MNTGTYPVIIPIKKVILRYSIFKIFNEIKNFKKLLIISSNSILTLFDINNFSDNQYFRIHNSNIIDADFLSEYSLVGSIDDSNNININKIKVNYMGDTFKSYRENKIKTNHFNSRIFFTRNKNQILLVGHKIELWDFYKKRCKRSYLFNHNENIKDIALNKNNNIFIAKSNSSVYFFHKDYSTFLSKLNFNSIVNQVKWITSSKFSITISKSSIHFYDLNNLKFPIKVVKFKV
mmetsp:Transcript_17840/g.24915  ORF Transcript_17840/g.24915 Transcript_17840/m.24915 type:complete len:234 (-) Transcript_17840:1742-2443(-)